MAASRPALTSARAAASSARCSAAAAAATWDAICARTASSCVLVASASPLKERCSIWNLRLRSAASASMVLREDHNKQTRKGHCTRECLLALR